MAQLNLFNYNNGAYSETGHPFSNGHLKLLTSYLSVEDISANTSQVSITVDLYNYGISWGYRSGRDVVVYWNETEIIRFAPPSLDTTVGTAHTTRLGTATFILPHNQDGTLSGRLRVDWLSTSLSYTSGGVTKNITELGSAGDITFPTIANNPPTATFTHSETTFQGQIVLGKSVCTVDITASAVSPAEIAKYTVYFGNSVVAEGTSPQLSFTITSSGDIKVMVTDSKGVTYTTPSQSITAVDYIAPVMTTYLVQRCNSSGIVEEMGTYAKCEATFVAGKFGTSDIETTCTATVGSETPVTIQNESFSIAGDGHLSIDSSYDVTFVLDDGVSQVTFATKLPIAFITFSALSGGKGFAFGKRADTEDIVDFAMDAVFRKKFTISNNNYESVSLEAASGAIIPDEDLAYSLGNSTRRFTDLYGNAMYDAEGEAFTITEVTNAVTRTSGASISSQKLIKYGKVVHLYLNIKYSTRVTSGNNLFVGTVGTAYRPKVMAGGGGYYSGGAALVNLDTDGSLTIRVCGGTQIQATNGMGVMITYLLA